ncbi:MAG: nicotinate (nicotinamide) nucleotide adenylyltransferase [Oscillospiraceae bacterium]
MKILIYGGSFNPPHMGHVLAARAAREALKPDLLLIIPACVPPHKALAESSAPAERRLEMAKVAFSGLENTLVSDMEIARGGKSYTADTLRALQARYPGADFTLLMGTDMLLCFESWREAEFLMSAAALGVFPREEGERGLLEEKAAHLRETYGANVTVIPAVPHPAASTDIRAELRQRRGRELLPEEVYAYIIRCRLYGAKPEFPWLREQAAAMLKPKRVPHVLGCEQEAVRLARRWGEDEEDAAEAGILHDITKKFVLDEQLLLCEKYGIIADSLESRSEKLLHSKTGAAVARDKFGASDRVCEAIRWHTTGKADMSLLEKILYMADYIEPTRDFEGVDTLRRLAYQDLDEAMILGLEMSLEDITSRGEPPHENTVKALAWLKDHRQ